MAWIVRLAKTGEDGEEQGVDVMTINRPDDLGLIAHLGLAVADGKLLLAGLQQEIVAPLVDVRTDGFDFLGYHFEADQRWPREKSLKTFKGPGGDPAEGGRSETGYR